MRMVSKETSCSPAKHSERVGNVYVFFIQAGIFFTSEDNIFCAVIPVSQPTQLGPQRYVGMPFAVCPN